MELQTPNTKVRCLCSDDSHESDVLLTACKSDWRLDSIDENCAMPVDITPEIALKKKSRIFSSRMKKKMFQQTGCLHQWLTSKVLSSSGVHFGLYINEAINRLQEVDLHSFVSCNQIFLWKQEFDKAGNFLCGYNYCIINCNIVDKWDVCFNMGCLTFSLCG